MTKSIVQLNNTKEKYILYYFTRVDYSLVKAVVDVSNRSLHNIIEFGVIFT